MAGNDPQDDDDEEPPPYPGDADEPPPSYPAGPVIKCPKGHIMERQSPESLPQGCGLCGCSACNQVGPPATFVGCRICDYDLCQSCKQKQIALKAVGAQLPTKQRLPGAPQPGVPLGVGGWGGKNILPAKSVAPITWAKSHVRVDEKLLCKDYQSGKCDRGDRCKFQHQEQFDINGPPDLELGEMIQEAMDHNGTFNEQFKELCDRVWGPAGPDTPGHPGYNPKKQPAAFLKNALRHCCGGFYQGMICLPSKDSMKKGDWVCPVPKGGCGSHNFAKRNTCMNCSKIRPLEDIGLPGISQGIVNMAVVGNSAVLAQVGTQKGDWICDKGKGGCGALNFARRTECATAGCGRMRPGSVLPPSELQAAGAVCRLGRRCWRPECVFEHPEGRDADSNTKQVLDAHGPKMPKVVSKKAEDKGDSKTRRDSEKAGGSKDKDRRRRSRSRSRSRDRRSRDKKDRARSKSRTRRDRSRDRSRDRDRDRDRRDRRRDSGSRARRRRRSS